MSVAEVVNYSSILVFPQGSLYFVLLVHSYREHTFNCLHSLFLSQHITVQCPRYLDPEFYGGAVEFIIIIYFYFMSRFSSRGNLSLSACEVVHCWFDFQVPVFQRRLSTAIKHSSYQSSAEFIGQSDRPSILVLCRNTVRL